MGSLFLLNLTELTLLYTRDSETSSALDSIAGSSALSIFSNYARNTEEDPSPPAINGQSTSVKTSFVHDYRSGS